MRRSVSFLIALLLLCAVPLFAQQFFSFLTIGGSTSGTLTITAPAVAGSSNATFPATTGVIPVTTNTLISNTAPTIAAAGCGGAAASIVVNNGTGAFKVNVGTTPGSACTLTFPSATTGWNVTCNDITTQSTSVFVQKQTGAESQTSVTITNFSDVAAATAFTASDILKCTAAAD